jgi:hypothetical protein
VDSAEDVMASQKAAVHFVDADEVHALARDAIHS